MSDLGVPVSEDKTKGPTTKHLHLRLRNWFRGNGYKDFNVKNHWAPGKIASILSKEKVTLKKMQSLIGSLNFACRAVIPGRPFCRRLINFICGLTKPFHHLRITASVQKDLLMWLQIFQEFNGVSVFHDRYWVSNEDVQLYTDSAGWMGLGFWAYFAGKWTCGAWPLYWFDLGITEDITVLELFPILMSLYIWGNDLRSKKVMFRTDNMAVVHIINTMTSK